MNPHLFGNGVVGLGCGEDAGPGLGFGHGRAASEAGAEEVLPVLAADGEVVFVLAAAVGVALLEQVQAAFFEGAAMAEDGIGA